VAGASALPLIYELRRRRHNPESQARAEHAPSEERRLLRLLIDNMADYIYVKDELSRFVIANRELTELEGAKDPEELLGKTDFDFFPREIATSFFEDEQAVIRSGKPLINREEECVDAKRKSQVEFDHEGPSAGCEWLAHRNHGNWPRPDGAETDGSGNAKGAGGGRTGQLRQKRVPREHEPRDSHTDEWNHRHDGPGPGHGTHAGAA
jgi:PAS domain S-box-containing protein